MPIYSFRCKDCRVNSEKLIPMRDRDLPQVCEDCGGVLERQIDKPRFKLDPISGDFPGASIEWEKRRKDQLARENKILAEHGSLNGYDETTS